MSNHKSKRPQLSLRKYRTEKILSSVDPVIKNLMRLYLADVRMRLILT